MDISTKQEVRVFEVKESGRRKNTMLANLSSYEGKDKDDKAIYSSWRASFVSEAYNKAKELNDKDIIILTKAKVENQYNKDTEKNYTTVVVFDFDLKEKE